MATIKSHTTLEQARVLSDILPLESADMRYAPFGDTHPWVWDEEVKRLEVGAIPCWSLAALLEEIPYEICNDDGNSAYLSMYKENDNYQLVYESFSDDFDDIETDVYKDFIDACYEMIITLSKNALI